MIIDGKEIARDVYRQTAHFIQNEGLAPRLTIFSVAPERETKIYLRLKEKKAQEIGVSVDSLLFDSRISTADLVASIKEKSDETDGLLVQLPLPPSLDTNRVLEAIPTDCDVDALNSKTTRYLSPVVSAMRVILMKYGISVSGTSVAILGEGRLVGRPARTWFEKMGASVSVFTKESGLEEDVLQQADIIVAGAGVPGLITEDLVKEGAVVFDAATTESNGVLYGDVDPSVARKASLFTPVPGGIGPITIATLLENVARASLMKKTAKK